MALSLTEYSTSAAASIAAGSVVEIAGAFFTFAGDESINASSWTSIVTGTTAYITLTPSGTAGSQIVDAAYTSTAPTWRDDFQGWYASAASNMRIIGTVYKEEATSYKKKYIFTTKQDILFPVIPYRVTTETLIKTLGYDTLTALTTISSVYHINGAYASRSGAPTDYNPTFALFLSSGTIYATQRMDLSTTTISFVVNYVY